MELDTDLKVQGEAKQIIIGILNAPCNCNLTRIACECGCLLVCLLYPRPLFDKSKSLDPGTYVEILPGGEK